MVPVDLLMLQSVNMLVSRHTLNSIHHYHVWDHDELNDKHVEHMLCFIPT